MLLEGVLPVLARRAVLAMGHSPSFHGAWLTQREQRVLDLLTLGQSVREIAEALDRSPHTVHDHVKSLHRKFGASSRGELVARALGRLAERERVRLGNDLPGFVTIRPPAPETPRYVGGATTSAVASDRDPHGLQAAMVIGSDRDTVRRPTALPDRFLTGDVAPAARLAKALHRREG
jgi:DNA-binding CsgD family transcriptional regulator